MADQTFDAPLGELPYDAYMQVEGHPGESTDAKHTDWIEVKQYRHQLEQKIASSFSGSGAPTAGQANHGFFWVCKEQDKTSPKLHLALLKGEAISEIKLDFCTQAGDKQSFMTVTMKNNVIASLHTSGAVIPAGVEGIPISKPCEWVGIAYGEIEWNYTELDPKTGATKGSIVTHWNRNDNTGG